MISRFLLRFETLSTLSGGILFLLLGKFVFNKVWADSYDYRITKWMGLVFAAAFIYSLARFLEEEINPRKIYLSPRLFFEILISAGIAFGIYKCGSGYFVDDSGFILRYLDNFQNGYFYCFNPEEGPIFGLSGFLFGLVSGLPVMIGIIGPEQSLFFFSYLGLFFTVLLLIRIIAELTGSKTAVIPLACLALFGGRHFIESANAGMEMNFHIALLLGSILAFIKNHHKAFWLLLALSVISKLDAVPIAFILSTGYFIRNFRGFAILSFKNPLIKAPLLFGALPLLLWIVFAEILFGSPLPQSAFAKVYYHAHPDATWFPFLSYFNSHPGTEILFRRMIDLVVVQVLISLAARKRIFLKEYLFFYCFAGNMTLYYFYNPAEAMVWYYAFPELMVMAQLAVSLYFISQKISQQGSQIIAPYAAALILMLATPSLMKDVAWFNQYQQTVEGERTRIGEYVSQKVGANDTLLSGHGIISRKSKGFVLDISGLNSKVAIPHQLLMEPVVKEFQPRYAVHHGLKDWVNNVFFKQGYVLDTTFYEVTLYNYSPWRFFRKPKSGEGGLRLWILDEAQVSGEELTRNNENNCNKMIFKKLNVDLLGKINDDAYFTMAIYKKLGEFKIHIRDYAGDSLLGTAEISIPPLADQQARVSEIRFLLKKHPEIDARRRLEIWPDEEVGKAEGLDPAYLIQ